MLPCYFALLYYVFPDIIFSRKAFKYFTFKYCIFFLKMLDKSKVG